MTTTVDLGAVGFWRAGALLTPSMAVAAERLGYGAVWIGGSPAADLTGAQELLDATERIVVSTGIVNIWTAPADEVAQSFHRMERSHPGRFVLGIGIGHREALGERFVKPYAALNDYLDVLDAEGVPASRRIISALGPRTLRLAVERAVGTHPYLTTPEHTRWAREVTGPDFLLAPEQRLVPGTDPVAARETGRRFLERYVAMQNYRRTLESLGFTAEDLDEPSDTALDSLTPHGTTADLAAAVRGHQAAGAGHVCVQVLPPKLDPLPTLEALSDALGLR